MSQPNQTERERERVREWRKGEEQAKGHIEMVRERERERGSKKEKT